MRELDRQSIEMRGVSSLDLMDRAAQALCDAAMAELPRSGERRAAIFCGSGNNGGDGIAAARLLFLRGVRLRVFLVGCYEKLTPDALTQTGRLSECGIQLETFDPQSDSQRVWTLQAQILVDAVFGVGLSREIRSGSVQYDALELLNAAPGKVLSADIPSGVEAASGRILGCAVKADRTVTFTLPKIGTTVGEGGGCAGAVTVADIGIPGDLRNELVCPAQTVELALVRQALPGRKADGHKGTFGKLLIVGGAVGYTGAPYLAAHAAVRSGCGLVELGVPASIWAVEAEKCVSAMPFPLPDQNGMCSIKALQSLRKKAKKCTVLALGPGLGRSEQTERLTCALLEETEQPVVLDADGINALAAHIDSLDARRGRVTVLTPHDGEFARLLGKKPAEIVHGDRVGLARDFALEHQCILVLKGHPALTAMPSGNVLVNVTGNSGLAKGGSGDVLTGIIAALLAQGASPMGAAVCGVYLHGLAGDLAQSALTAYGMTPLEIADFLPMAFRQVLGRSDGVVAESFSK